MTVKDLHNLRQKLKTADLGNSTDEDLLIQELAALGMYFVTLYILTLYVLEVRNNKHK